MPIVPVVLALAALALATLLVVLRAAPENTAAGPVNAAVPVAAFAGFAVAAAFIAVGAGSFYLGTGIVVGVPTGLLVLLGLRAIAGRGWSWPAAIATIALGLLAIPASVLAFLFGGGARARHAGGRVDRGLRRARQRALAEAGIAPDDRRVVRGLGALPPRADDAHRGREPGRELPVLLRRRWGGYASAPRASGESTCSATRAATASGVSPTSSRNSAGEPWVT